MPVTCLCGDKPSKAYCLKPSLTSDFIENKFWDLLDLVRLLRINFNFVEMN